LCGETFFLSTAQQYDVTTCCWPTAVVPAVPNGRQSKHGVRRKCATGRMIQVCSGNMSETPQPTVRKTTNAHAKRLGLERLKNSTGRPDDGSRPFGPFGENADGAYCGESRSSPRKSSSEADWTERGEQRGFRNPLHVLFTLTFGSRHVTRFETGRFRSCRVKNLFVHNVRFVKPSSSSYRSRAYAIFGIVIRL